MTAVHGGVVAAVLSELAAETMDVVNAIIDTNADDNRGNGNGHDIQRNADQAHDPQHKTGCEHARGQQIGRQRQHRQAQRAKQHPEHGADGQEHHAQR